jgi:hypothetical protein
MGPARMLVNWKNLFRRVEDLAARDVALPTHQERRVNSALVDRSFSTTQGTGVTDTAVRRISRSENPPDVVAGEGSSVGTKSPFVRPAS